MVLLEFAFFRAWRAHVIRLQKEAILELLRARMKSNFWQLCETIFQKPIAGIEDNKRLRHLWEKHGPLCILERHRVHMLQHMLEALKNSDASNTFKISEVTSIVGNEYEGMLRCKHYHSSNQEGSEVRDGYGRMTF